MSQLPYVKYLQLIVMAMLCASLYYFQTILQQGLPEPREQQLAALKEKLDSFPRRSMQAIYVNTEKVKQKGEGFLEVWGEQTLQQCLLDERDFQVMEQQFLKPWVKALQNKSKKQFKGLFLPGGRYQSWASKQLGLKRDQDGVQEYSWEIQNVEVNQPQFIAELSQLVDEFAQIDNATLSVDEFYIEQQKRLPNGSFQQASLKASLSIAGIDTTGKRMVHRGHLLIPMIQNKGYWQAIDVQIDKMETIKQTGELFYQKVDNLGALKLQSQHLRREAIRRGGYALALHDFDKDGILDLLVGQEGPLELYRGIKGSGYEKVNQTGFEHATMVKAAGFADFDDDGFDDIFISRFSQQQGVGDLEIYKNIDGRSFIKQEKPFSDRLASDYAMPAAIGDFNNDGLLDIYVGFPGKQDFTVPRISTHKPYGSVHGLFINKGLQKFADKTKQYKLLSQFDNAVYPHGAFAYDLDLDGDLDLFIMDDRGQLSPIYLNQKHKGFQIAAKKLNILNYGYGMGITAGDLNADGVEDVVMSNVNFVAAKRLEHSCEKNWRVFSDRYRLRAGYAEGVRIFQGNPGQSYQELKNPFGLAKISEGSAGVSLLDFNNDGLLDIYLTAGLWTGKGAEDLSSYFSRLVAAHHTSMAIGLGAFSGQGESFLQMLLVNQTPSLAGNQKNQLFRNNGDGTYTELGYFSGIDSLADGYMAAVGDLNQNGKLDLVLHNAAPGVEANQFDVLQVFENSHPEARSLRVKLIGSRSNRGAIGAWARLYIEGGGFIQRQLQPMSGAVQSESVLHFGLGEKSKPLRLVIHWPSGIRQEILAPKARYLVIKEEESKAFRVSR